MNVIPLDPVSWCQKMMDEAQDGDEAYVYFQLLEMWNKRLGRLV